MNLLTTEKVWENTEIFHILRCLSHLELITTHNIPIFWECTISHKMAIFCGKSCHSQVVGFRSYYKTQIIHGVTVMQNFIRWEYYGKKLIYSHIMGFEYKYIEFKNPHNSQIQEISSHRFPNVWEEFFLVHGKQWECPFLS